MVQYSFQNRYTWKHTFENVKKQCRGPRQLIVKSLVKGSAVKVPLTGGPGQAFRRVMSVFTKVRLHLRDMHCKALK